MWDTNRPPTGSTSTASAASNHDNEEQPSFERSKSVPVGNTKNNVPRHQKTPLQLHCCCVCGFTADRTHFIRLASVSIPWKRAVWFTALGLSQEHQRWIETEFRVHPMSLFLCPNHLPSVSFRQGHPLPRTLPLKMDTNRKPIASTSTDSSATNYHNEKFFPVGNANDTMPGDTEKPVRPCQCCSCGFTGDRSHFFHLTTVPKKRTANLNALGVSQKVKKFIETKLSVHPSALFICKSHFPRYGRRLPQVLPLKTDADRTSTALRETSTESTGKCISLLVRSAGHGQQSDCYLGITDGNEVEKEHEWSCKARNEREVTPPQMVEEQPWCGLEEDLFEEEPEPLERHPSCSPEKEDRQLSQLQGSESWTSLVNALHPSTNKMNADELNDHQAMMSIMTSNNIDPEVEKSSWSASSTLCVSSLDMMPDESEPKYLFHPYTHKNNSPKAHYSIRPMEPFRLTV